MRLAPTMLALALSSASLHAQRGPLSVLRHTPGDTASPGNIVSVTFDRPVAGRLDATVEASRIFHIEPAIAGHVEWRDPITIRFVPDAPLTPGDEFTVSIGTAFDAIDGSRLARPYRFTFRVPGPRLLGQVFNRHYSSAPPVLPLDGRFTLVYSAPVDLERLSRGSRLQLTQCDGKPVSLTVPIRAARQRSIGPKDGYEYSSAGGWDRDTVADRFRRIVEMEPTAPLPPGCGGQFVRPNTVDDQIHGAEEQFAIQTLPRFQLRPLECATLKPVCPLDGLVLRFTADVDRDQVKRFVRLEPGVPLTLPEPQYNSRARDWTFRVRLAPRSSYTVVVDTALRDVDGRRLEGPTRATFKTGDYLPSVGFAVGTIVVPHAGGGKIPIRHINVRSVRILAARIPEANNTAVLSVGGGVVEYELAKLRLQTETTTVAVRGDFNAEATTMLPLPASVTASGAGVVAVRLEVAESIEDPERAPESTDRTVVGLKPVIITATPRNRAWNAPTVALVQVSDLAVHARIGPGESTVLVTGVSDGLPRAGAVVQQRDAKGDVVARGTTGFDGLASLEIVRAAGEPGVRTQTKPIGDDWPPRVGLVEATFAGDRIVMPLSVRQIGYEPMNPLDPSGLGGRVSRVPSLTATLFADRGIYRPGEMLYLKGIIRQGSLGALRVVPGQQVRLTLTYHPTSWDGRDDVLMRDTVLTANEFGTVADSSRLGTGLVLGQYVAELHVGEPGEWETVASETMRVAEYRAPEFLVEAHADSVPRFAGDTVRVRASGRYLFGAPMGRAAVQWSAELREAPPWDFHIPGVSGWTLGAWDWWGEGRATEQPLSGTDTLDLTGVADLHVPLGGFHPSLPGRADVTVAVTDVNRQTVVSSVSVPVHPARLYVLARRQSKEWFWTAGKRAVVELRTVAPDGAERPGVAVTVSLVKRKWMWDSRSGNTRWIDTTLRTDTVRTASRPVPYELVPADGALYELRLTADDGQGATARTTLSAWVVANGAGWRPESAYHLPLIAPREELSVGDEVQVAFDSPFDDAEALVTVERERQLERRRIRVHSGANVIPLTITEVHVPNVFVSVLLIRRSPPQTLPDSAAELVRAGFVELKVKSSLKRLVVRVEPQATEYGPGANARVRVRVHDVSGRGVRSEVALWAVDQGVLALTDFPTPDAVARMYAPRGLGARLWSSLPMALTADPGLVVLLAKQASFALNEVVSVGNSVAAMASPIQLTMEAMRSKFRSTAFYIAAGRTNDRGEALLSARLPDNLTTYRVMAVAIGADDRFGSGDTTLLVTRPLVARPSLPRFVRAGDTLLAGAVVNARDGRSHAVAVEASTEGINLVDGNRREMKLAEGKGAEVRFSFGVPPRDRVRDTVTVRLRASDGNVGDAAETRLPVQPDFHPRVHTQLGALSNAGDVVMELPADIDPARSRLSLRVGTSPLAPMLAAYDWLRVYPYYCTEQIVSGGRALLAVWKATRDRDAKALGGDPRPRLQELADQVARRQAADGSIRYWDDFDWTTPWLSVYAGTFLLEARDQGISVDSTTISRLATYLTGVAALPVDTGGMNRYDRRANRLRLGGRVAVVEFLRRAGKPSTAKEDELLRLAPLMTWEDRLRLAESLAPRTDVRGLTEGIVYSAWSAVKIAGRRVDLPDSAFAEREFLSHVAPAARLLTATIALRPNQPLLGGLVETLLQNGRAEGRWAWSTQDYASVIMALAALSAGEDRTRELRVTAQGHQILSGRVGQADSAAVPLSGLIEHTRSGTTIRLHLDASRGERPLYYAVSVNEVPRVAPVTPDIQGIVVERWYERFSDGRPVTSVQEGELVRVRLRVTVPADREFVAVEDPLPAGLEPVDVSLKTTASLKAFVTPQSERARMRNDRDRDGPGWQSWLYGRWDDGWWSPWEHKAMHDDKVVYFARMLWKGSYTASYVVRATTAGNFVRPPAHAEEMYNPALQGRSDGGRFGVEAKRP